MATTTAVVGVTTGVMKPLLSKLTKLLGEEYAKLKGVRKQIKFLRDELSTMSATLEMLADSDQQLNPEMRNWRDKLRELAYDLEDCIDDFMSRVDHEHDGKRMGFKKYFRKLKKLKIANEIEELKIRAIEASERHKRYNFDQLAHNSSTFGIDPRLPAFYEEVGRLVGIDGPKERIIELLAMEMKGSLKVVSIVGCGGLAFVSVSQSPDMKKVLNDTAEGVGISSHTPPEPTFVLEQKPNNVGLSAKKKTVPMIDFSEIEEPFVLPDEFCAKEIDEHQIDGARDLENTEKTLEGHHMAKRDIVHVKKSPRFSNTTGKVTFTGNRIMTTTLSVTVASCCSSQDGYIYEMKLLSFDDSKWLFLKRAFDYENSHYPHTEDVLDKILQKCGGLPLAIITISSLLLDQHEFDEWHRVLNAIGSGLARDPNAETMSNILSLSCKIKGVFDYYSVMNNWHRRLLVLIFGIYSRSGFGDDWIFR
uniref:Disease resistance N-terminal domain-containing protein n=1 Tax=Oryza glumipatula TaxID=40148 RepID=A0A0E0BSU5_9ORYZ